VNNKVTLVRGKRSDYTGRKPEDLGVSAMENNIEQRVHPDDGHDVNANHGRIVADPSAVCLLTIG